MKSVKPETHLIAKTGSVEYHTYLNSIGANNYNSNAPSDGEELIEFMGRNCYDDQTEILTNEGWKLFSNLNNKEKVLTLNPDTHKSEWQEYTQISYNYSGRMLLIKSRPVDLLVTPDHRFFVQRQTANSTFSDWYFTTADVIGTKAIYRVKKVSGEIEGVDPPEFIETDSYEYKSGKNYKITRNSLSVKLPIIPFLKLMGYYISEGHLGCANEAFTLTQSDGPVFDKIKSVITECGLPYNAHKDPRKPHINQVSVGGGLSFRKYIEENFGKGSKNKKIPRWILNLSSKYLSIIFQSMMEGDGSRNKHGFFKYNTVSSELADNVQELLLRTGKSASIGTFVIKETGTTMYGVRILENDIVGIRSSSRKWINYTGKVWCVSTQNGIIYVRRNKKALFCGNCYKSWEPGLNKNVTKVRTDNQIYLENLLKSGHGSCLEHVSASFVFQNVSRVFTAELERHRVGTAISQESLRYVRLEDISFWTPSCFENDEYAKSVIEKVVRTCEEAQIDLARHFKLDETPDFGIKKEITSAMRRLAPEGLATVMGWTANIRTLRHVIEMRTSRHAEEEIRLVFNQVGEICRKEWPHLFADYEVEMVNGHGEWTTPYSKV